MSRPVGSDTFNLMIVFLEEQSCIAITIEERGEKALESDRETAVYPGVCALQSRHRMLVRLVRKQNSRKKERVSKVCTLNQFPTLLQLEKESKLSMSLSISLSESKTLKEVRVVKDKLRTESHFLVFTQDLENVCVHQRAFHSEELHKVHSGRASASQASNPVLKMPISFYLSQQSKMGEEVEVLKCMQNRNVSWLRYEELDKKLDKSPESVEFLLLFEAFESKNKNKKKDEKTFEFTSIVYRFRLNSLERWNTATSSWKILVELGNVAKENENGYGENPQESSS